MRTEPRHALALATTLATALAVSAVPTIIAQEPAWRPVPGRIATRWARDVSPDRVHPEYPRPQLVRGRWQNLNGLWDYAILPLDAERPTGDWDGRILVPFPVESSLSGVGKRVGAERRLWYRRSFEIDKAHDGRLLLHFGAVDWHARVFVDGTAVGEHHGGYDPFSFDVTAALGEGPRHELVVSVFDPSDRGTQPRGKQVESPHGIWYTPTTGIWQTVWLEPVPERSIRSLRITPDQPGGKVRIAVDAGGGAEAGKASVRIAVTAGDRIVARATGDCGAEIELSLPEPRAWWPDDPFLYDLKVDLLDAGGAAVDSVASYFGLRRIEVAKGPNGHERLCLNGVPLFQLGTLDQGFWPDGLYTAPTDQALAYDVEVLKRLGFNMVRKHVKVEPDRWYYHCDRLGLLVWQDMPSGDRGANWTGDPAAQGREIERSPESARQFEQELLAIVGALRNHPSIVMWVPFNEAWGQFDTVRIAELLQRKDPTRLVDCASGGNDFPAGDVVDAHSYPGPAAPPVRPGRARVLGEWGGLGLPLHGHTWQDEKNWGYRSFPDRESLTADLLRRLLALRPLQAEGLAAAVYTQTTDVEIEVNGLLTYDREVIKVAEADVAALQRELTFVPPLAAGITDAVPRIRTLLPTSESAAQEWRVTLDEPPAGWTAATFDDSGWRAAPGGFGTRGTPGAKVGTTWDTSDIWLRRRFTLDVPAGGLTAGRTYLRIHHDEDAEVHLNGELAATASGWVTGYTYVVLPAALLEQDNVLAVRCHQTGGGQFIDVGIVEVAMPGDGAARTERKKDGAKD